MRRKPTAIATLVLLWLVASAAAAWRIDASAPLASLEAFHDHFASALYAFPRHAAAPLGVTGFEIAGFVGYQGDFDEETFAAEVIEGDLPFDALMPYGLSVRKGLPWDVDLGLSWSRALSSDLDRFTLEGQWAFFEGGPATPAIALRVTFGQGENDVYRLRQSGAEILISKGFAVLTPFAGVGAVYSEGRFARPDDADPSFSTTGAILYAGATLNLLLPKITAAVEKGEDVVWVVQVGFGF